MIICFLFVLLLVKKNTDIYLSVAGHYPYDRLDMQIEIDGEQIFFDTVYYSAFLPQKIQSSLNIGFHNISVKSHLLGIKKEKKVFLFFNQYILIEFFNEVDLVRENPEFSIKTDFSPLLVD